jgi:hypothetical protein
MIIIALLLGLLPAAQTHREPACTEWRECRAMALAAADRGEFETFHDLAWRAVQTGPRNDAALMLLLARAQALSGRPHDALVMLDRLADMGVASDALTNADFARTRELPGWPDVAAKIERTGAVPPAPAPRPAPASPPKPMPVVPKSAPPAPKVPPAPAAAVTPPAPEPAPAAPTPPPAPSAPPPPPPTPAAAAAVPIPSPRREAVRFSTPRLTAVGLAYDGVSRRFVIGDRLARKLVVVGEASQQLTDLVRAESAGFHTISALAIDDRRGDLWVASADADGTGTLHRLQLVSGRPLKSFAIAQDRAPVNPVDVALTRGGTAIVLDAGGGRLLSLRPGAAAVDTLARIDLTAPTSVAIGADDAVAYVAHRDGIARVDLRSHKTTRVAAAKNVSLANLRQIRWHRDGLVAVESSEGSNRIVRLDLDAAGRTVRRAKTLDAGVDIAGDGCVAIVGNELLYLSPAGAGEFVAYRIPLR